MPSNFTKAHAGMVRVDAAISHDSDAKPTRFEHGCSGDGCFKSGALNFESSPKSSPDHAELRQSSLTMTSVQLPSAAFGKVHWCWMQGRQRSCCGRRRVPHES